MVQQQEFVVGELLVACWRVLRGPGCREVGGVEVLAKWSGHYGGEPQWCLSLMKHVAQLLPACRSLIACIHALLCPSISCMFSLSSKLAPEQQVAAAAVVVVVLPVLLASRCFSGNSSFAATDDWKCFNCFV